MRPRRERRAWFGRWGTGAGDPASRSWGWSRRSSSGRWQRPTSSLTRPPPKADGEGDDRGREVLYNELGFLELEKYIESEVQEMSTGSADGADGAVSREPRVALTAPPILALPGGSAGAEKKDVSLWDLFNAFDTNGDG